MNCANHPETPAVAYCQYCGKPLCAQCIHKVNNVISCEPCLAARVHAATAGSDPNFNNAQDAQYSGAGSFSPGNIRPQPLGADTWVILGLISWIPGVGAMYNGQLAKGLAHVLIFAILVHLTHYNGLLGLLVAAWIVYQVFDAYQTALARRDGLPLPNPLGLNNVGQWFSARGHGSHPGGPYSSAGPMTSNQPAPATPPATGETGPISGFASGYVPPYPGPPVSPNQYDPPDLWRRGGRHGLPTGAVILIVLGVLFLLGNFGILNENWLDRGWPILLIALGVWIVIRRSQTPPAGGVR